MSAALIVSRKNWNCVQFYYKSFGNINVHEVPLTGIYTKTVQHNHEHFVSFQTFCLYPYFEDKPLDAGKVFSGLALFAILSIPLFLITVVMNGLSHALVSVRRLRDFLFAQEIERCADDVSNDDNGDVTVKPMNGDLNMKESGSHEEQEVLVTDRAEYSGISGKAVVAGNVPPVVNVDADDDSECVKSHHIEDERQETGDMIDDRNIGDGIVVEISNGCFAWDANTKLPIIRNLNVQIGKGNL